MQLSIFAATISYASSGIFTENFSPLWGFCILIFAGEGFLGVIQGGLFSINIFGHFWNFHYNCKNCVCELINPLIYSWHNMITGTKN